MASDWLDGAGGALPAVLPRPPTKVTNEEASALQRLHAQRVGYPPTFDLEDFGTSLFWVHAGRQDVGFRGWIVRQMAARPTRSLL
jgi:hypothetical protein